MERLVCGDADVGDEQRAMGGVNASFSVDVLSVPPRHWQLRQTSPSMALLHHILLQAFTTIIAVVNVIVAYAGYCDGHTSLRRRPHLLQSSQLLISLLRENAPRLTLQHHRRRHHHRHRRHHLPLHLP